MSRPCSQSAGHCRGAGGGVGWPPPHVSAPGCTITASSPLLKVGLAELHLKLHMLLFIRLCGPFHEMATQFFTEVWHISAQAEAEAAFLW